MHEIKATVIIPARDRVNLVERAVNSIVKLDISNIVEIIVVDDASNPQIKRTKNMRVWDKIIRLDKNAGGAVARNMGIKAAKGDLIYLLDSDDYFLEMDFEKDFLMAKKNHIYYVDINMAGNRKNFPETIGFDNFFENIFLKNPGICQTSSLMFLKNEKLFFDESLPKHQDWDFILFSCILNGITPVKKNGCIFLDLEDKSSLSRKYTPKKSTIWINKLINSGIVSEKDRNYIELMCKDTIEDKSKYYIFISVLILLIKNKISLKKSLGIVYRNFKRV